ncbi:hypothetical protein LCGC14_2758930 [marine sediment metagenome]|uniref:Uncharacterized protein n=1 Tax=marine sediment metagenome TaxID=412755 RepID=A0A0F9BR84_9ZZZZ
MDKGIELRMKLRINRVDASLVVIKEFVERKRKEATWPDVGAMAEVADQLDEIVGFIQSE